MGDGRGLSIECDDVSELLAAVAAGEETLSRSQRAHVDHCLRCQAEVVQHRRILRTMRQLRDDVIEPAPGLLPEMLAGLHEMGERSAVRSLVGGRPFRYSVAIAGLGVAAATGTVLTIRLRRSSRRSDGAEREAADTGGAPVSGAG